MIVSRSKHSKVSSSATIRFILGSSSNCVLCFLFTEGAFHISANSAVASSVHCAAPCCALVCAQQAQRFVRLFFLRGFSDSRAELCRQTVGLWPGVWGLGAFSVGSSAEFLGNCNELLHCGLSRRVVSPVDVARRHSGTASYCMAAEWQPVLHQGRLSEGQPRHNDVHTIIQHIDHTFALCNPAGQECCCGWTFADLLIFNSFTSQHKPKHLITPDKRFAIPRLHINPRVTCFDRLQNKSNIPISRSLAPGACRAHRDAEASCDNDAASCHIVGHRISEARTAASQFIANTRRCWWCNRCARIAAGTSHQQQCSSAGAMLHNRFSAAGALGAAVWEWGIRRADCAEVCSCVDGWTDALQNAKGTQSTHATAPLRCLSSRSLCTRHNNPPPLLPQKKRLHTHTAARKLWTSCQSPLPSRSRPFPRWSSRRARSPARTERPLASSSQTQSAPRLTSPPSTPWAARPTSSTTLSASAVGGGFGRVGVAATRARVRRGGRPPARCRFTPVGP